MKNRIVVVNLIPFNEFEGNSHKCPDDQTVQGMRDILLTYGVAVYVRQHHGRDIAAACGQLAKAKKENDSCSNETSAPVH
jgi:adenine C2-methylase RlmN of 23S rRNA A2503 and tRNA A37